MFTLAKKFDPFSEKQNPSCEKCNEKKAPCYHPVCTICCEHIDREKVGGLTITQIPGCSHVFHTVCIMPWLEKCTKCPVCKTVVSDTREITSTGVRKVTLEQTKKNSDFSDYEPIQFDPNDFAEGQAGDDDEDDDQDEDEDDYDDERVTQDEMEWLQILDTIRRNRVAAAAATAAEAIFIIGGTITQRNRDRDRT